MRQEVSEADEDLGEEDETESEDISTNAHLQVHTNNKSSLWQDQANKYTLKRKLRKKLPIKFKLLWILYGNLLS